MTESNRLERVLDKAADVLGTRERAEEWIEKRSATLGATPRELADTEDGTRQVLLHLTRISQHSLN
jgi:uncharacterized protein (DUF2384 family)